MKKLLYNALIVNDGETFKGYLTIDGDTIELAERGDAPTDLIDSADYEATDCDGDLIMPGAIDTHVHFRDPGLTDKGDIASESRAAVAGGVTSYFDMPNTKPATVTIEAWNDKMNHAATTSTANYAFFIGATNDNLGTLLKADYTRIPGIKLFMGSSTGNMLVDSESMLDDLFAKSPTVIVVHAEDEDTIRANRAALEARYPQGEIPLTLHSTMRSSDACFKASKHAVELARRHGARLHIAHISTAAELQLLETGDIDAKQITAETCPHYLVFTCDDIATRGARVKCNPAIKTETDRQALIDAIKAGKIDTIATDHAPHLVADKQGDLLHAASGMPGVQFSLPMMLTLGFTPGDTARVMSHNPAKLFGITGRGFLVPGYKADIVRVSKLATPHTITDSDVTSRCQWTPYDSMETGYKVVTTWVNGHKAYDNGSFPDGLHSQPIIFKQSKTTPKVL